MKKISLLLSLYQSGEWIENRLKNLIDATSNIDAEIICINADSPDILDHDIPVRYLKIYNNIKYVKCETRIGIYDAWNEAIKISDSQYLAPANTDDLSGPTLYTTLCGVLDDNPNVGVSYTSWYTIGMKPNKWSDIDLSCRPDSPGEFHGNFDTGQVGHFPVWRKKIHDEIGYFDGLLTALGDADFWSRVYFKTNYCFYWLRAPLAAYRWRDGQNAWSRFISTEQWLIFHNNIKNYKDASSRH